MTEIIHFGHVVVEDTFEIRKIFFGGIHHLDHPSDTGVVPVWYECSTFGKYITLPSTGSVYFFQVIEGI